MNHKDTKDNNLLTQCLKEIKYLGVLVPLWFPNLVSLCLCG
jgi:hypothetical protein